MEIELKTTQSYDTDGVVVTGQWSGAYGGVVSAPADDDGDVEFESPEILVDADVTFTVLNISEPGLVYVPSKNRATSVTIPSPL
ncbi:MAG: hypothetical protein HKN74_01530 [Acidimicrobiia bacterium]|nr:hypothetical protein [Acidimicrobiia bacterium]NNF08945.1 hypothetical protein [Acidimicrobiia bacterium]NNL70429.1 hypothetical protein [Acidimicrobiia bacterium]